MKNFKIDVLNKGDELYADILREYERLQQEGIKGPFALSLTWEDYDTLNLEQRRRLGELFERFHALD